MLLCIKDLSQYLQIKPSTLYAWASQGRIPHVKIHGLIRFNKDEIDAWLESFRKEKIELPSIKPQGKHQDIDSLIERVKREVYNHPYGRPDRIKAGKDGD